MKREEFYGYIKDREGVRLNGKFDVLQIGKRGEIKKVCHKETFRVLDVFKCDIVADVQDIVEFPYDLVAFEDGDAVSAELFTWVKCTQFNVNNIRRHKEAGMSEEDAWKVEGIASDFDVFKEFIKELSNDREMVETGLMNMKKFKYNNNLDIEINATAFMVLKFEIEADALRPLSMFETISLINSEKDNSLLISGVYKVVEVDDNEYVTKIKDKRSGIESRMVCSNIKANKGSIISGAFNIVACPDFGLTMAVTNEFLQWAKFVGSVEDGSTNFSKLYKELTGKDISKKDEHKVKLLGCNPDFYNLFASNLEEQGIIGDKEIEEQVKIWFSMYFYTLEESKK